ncbi:twin-arginine translocase TatA/TatE family subunit [Streptomyces antarcticus]|uniref:twin-arginine translocase TatA/TatE family subunit n=1 Tax=Streptomyces antarcticus TaxID=2996458 RepID=UPI00226EE290|nr:MULTISPECIES: twin-arginine translocase TatA/TatE family subunit [unclassified Streptomyces]MCY0946541.1 twin-arginine translocase TatA/TatE family subunit [Streptomyces sp. H34-AA3]MCZ4086095.1 twin-arginine translocase TatA/TatE family subunit [Streptomyces sp. H34-S5]
MFGISEIAITCIIVILILGAKKLPELARSLGKSARILKSEARAMKSESGAQAPPAGGAAKRVIEVAPGDVTSPPSSGQNSTGAPRH